MKDYELNIYDIIETCSVFLQDPENEENKNKFNAMKQKMMVTEYMPLRQKENLLRKALIDIRTVDDESYHFTAAKEIAMLFDVLFAYVTSCDPNMDSVVKDYEFYDILYLAEIPQYILSFCGEDYKKIERMFDDTVSFDNIKQLLKEIEATTPEEINDLTKAFERFTLNTDTELIKNLGNIMAINDPLYNNIKETIEESAYGTIE